MGASASAPSDWHSTQLPLDNPSEGKHLSPAVPRLHRTSVLCCNCTSARQCFLLTAHSLPHTQAHPHIPGLRSSVCHVSLLQRAPTQEDGVALLMVMRCRAGRQAGAHRRSQCTSDCCHAERLQRSGEPPGALPCGAHTSGRPALSGTHRLLPGPAPLALRAPESAEVLP